MLLFIDRLHNKKYPVSFTVSKTLTLSKTVSSVSRSNAFKLQLQPAHLRLSFILDFISIILSSMQMKTDAPSFLRKMASIILESLWALTAGQKARGLGERGAL